MSDKPLAIYWFQNCKTDEDKAKMQQTLMGSSYILSVLKSIVEDQKRYIEASEHTEKDFDQPNWAEKQAFRNGKRSGLNFITQLLAGVA